MTLWGGRFSGKLDPAAWALNTSLPFDRRLASQDVAGSVAWASALAGAGVLTGDESRSIVAGLQAIAAEFAAGTFAYSAADEDIHSAVERRLGERIGPLAGKLHTGRSRNDQVATDFRLWMLEALPTLDAAIRGLQETLLTRAQGDLGILMPGYTHLQRAQPILLAHWWLAHFWALGRDLDRRLGAGFRGCRWHHHLHYHRDPARLPVKPGIGQDGQPGPHLRCRDADHQCGLGGQ